MATRFYLPSTGAAAVSPAFAVGWEDTTIATRLRCVTTKIGSAMTTVSFADGNAANRDILFRQYVSDPIEAQSIVIESVTIEFQIRASERDATCNMFTVLSVRVVSLDGNTVRGTWFAENRDATELAVGTLTNRRWFVSTTGSPIEALDGDRFVFEIGTGGDPAGGSDHDSDLRIGDASASDLPEDDASTTDDNPWIELQNTITFWQPDKWSSVWPQPFPDKKLVSPY